MSEATRVCKICGEEFPLTDFYRRWNRKLGKAYHLRTCRYCTRLQESTEECLKQVSERGRKYRQKPGVRERKLAYLRAWHKQHSRAKPPYEPPEGYKAPKELAPIYHLSASQIRNLANKGKIKSFLHKDRRYVLENSLTQWVHRKSFRKQED